jgi:hypothetical protein
MVQQDSIGTALVIKQCISNTINWKSCTITKINEVKRSCYLGKRYQQLLKPKLLANYQRLQTFRSYLITSKTATLN